MALRLIKVILPDEESEEALRLLEEQKPCDFWEEEAAGGQTAIAVLTSPQNSEEIMDLFEKKFQNAPGFRLILLPVQAALPRPEIDNNLPPEPGEEEKKKGIGTLRISREELYGNVADSSRLSWVFTLMVVISTIVVTIGLLKSNVAVIIGAMVVAPLLGPNVAAALATTLADSDLGINALKSLLTGIAVVFGISVIIGLIFPVLPGLPEISLRSRVDLADIALALSAGCAGVLAFTTGVSAALIGVMVAVALLPPLATAGLLLGAGYPQGAAAGLLLFLTNIICVNLAGVITFVLLGVKPGFWWEAEKAEKATRIAIGIWSLALVILAAAILIAYL